MKRALYLPAVHPLRAEQHYRRIAQGEAPALQCYLSERACRDHISAYPPAFREACKIWQVTERPAQDGWITVAQEVLAQSNVVMFRRAAG